MSGGSWSLKIDQFFFDWPFDSICWRRFSRQWHNWHWYCLTKLGSLRRRTYGRKIDFSLVNFIERLTFPIRSYSNELAPYWINFAFSLEVRLLRFFFYIADIYFQKRSFRSCSYNRWRRNPLDHRLSNWLHLQHWLFWIHCWMKFSTWWLFLRLMMTDKDSIILYDSYSLYDRGYCWHLVSSMSWRHVTVI